MRKNRLINLQFKLLQTKSLKRMPEIYSNNLNSIAKADKFWINHNYINLLPVTSVCMYACRRQ